MRKKKKNSNSQKMFLAFVAIIFLISSVGSVVLYSGNNNDPESFSIDLSNGKYKFDRRTDTYGNYYYDVTSKEGADFDAFYLPDKLYLDIPKDAQSLIQNSNYFYITFDPTQEDLSTVDFVRFEVRNNAPSSKFFIDSVISENSIYSFPILDCSNATINSPVVFLKSSNDTNINYENYCLEIEFVPQSTLQIKDALVYLLQGIDIG
jgi:hypothetical protein